MARRRKVVGLTRHSGTEATDSSTATVFNEIELALRECFNVKRLPFYWQGLEEPSLSNLTREFITDCDLVLDSPGFRDARMLRTRNALQIAVPIAWLDLGSVARGAVHLRGAFRELTQQDLLMFSSSADLSICDLLFAQYSARRCVLPLCVDESFHPFDSIQERQQVVDMRRHLQLGEDAIVFLYAGRISSEKNVHSIVLVFEQVLKRFPNAILLLVGDIRDVARSAFSATDQDLPTLYRQLLAERPALSARCRFNPPVNRSELPLVYNLADVFINLTLHGDENFGFGQVEAMACGLPIVGTAWGALHDTVRHGVNGFSVDTRINAWGVRADLHQAVRYCCLLARSVSLRRRLGRRGVELARKEYSRSALARRIRRELTPLAGRNSASSSRPREMRLSAFGARFQRVFCDDEGMPQAPQYSEATYDLYRRLIGPYASGSALQRGPEVALAPVSFRLTDRQIEIVDPLWPKVFRVESFERPLLERLGELSARGQRVFEVTALLGGSKSESARKALSSLVRKGLLVGTPPRWPDRLADLQGNGST